MPNPTFPLLAQANVVPDVGLLKLMGAPEADPQYVMFPMELTTGVGLTVTVKGRVGPVQVAVLGVTFIVLITIPDPVFVAVYAAIFPEPEFPKPTLEEAFQV